MPRLAIAPEFPQELSALPDRVRQDVMVSLHDFLAGAEGAPAPDRIRAARDPRVQALRLAEHHRGVVLHQDDVYLLLTVLPDADAWSYAQRHAFTINSAIGVLERWDLVALEHVESALTRAGSPAPLFAEIPDADLLGLGIDPYLLPLVRLITSEADVEGLEPMLPLTQHLPLAVLARNGSIAEAASELDSRRSSWSDSGPIDLADLYAGLLRSPGLAVFVADRRELDRLVEAPTWTAFLHPPQHRLAHAARYDHPVLVTGGAGTGKTLIALHRAAHLAAHGAGQVLLVTFSQGLAADLAAKLDVLVKDGALRKRVDVENVDRLAIRIVASAEGRQPVLVGPGARSLTELTEEALRLLARTSGDLLEELEPGRKPYRHVIVDEGQDLSAAQWRLLRALVPREPDDLFVVGDPHQRITDARVTLGAVGIHATQHTLRVSYRLAHESLAFGVRLRGGGPAGGLVKGAVELYGLRATRHGERPMIRTYRDAGAELTGLVTTVTSWLDDGVPPNEIAVAARSGALVKAAREALAEAGAAVRVSTLHGLKGLEFERVALVGITEGVVPERLPDDPATKARVLQRERGLLYVACTRARSLLYISHSGRGSPLLPS